MPKLPPPPRSPHKRSGWSFALAVRNRPSEVTTSAESRFSQVSPCLRCSHSMPPPRVRPAMPVVDTAPPVVASRTAGSHGRTLPRSGPGLGLGAAVKIAETERGG